MNGNILWHTARVVTSEEGEKKQRSLHYFEKQSDLSLLWHNTTVVIFGDVTEGSFWSIKRWSALGTCLWSLDLMSFWLQARLGSLTARHCLMAEIMPSETQVWLYNLQELLSDKSIPLVSHISFMTPSGGQLDSANAKVGQILRTQQSSLYND